MSRRRAFSRIPLVAPLLAALIAVGVVVAPIQSAPAEAADLSAFDPGLIITDEEFFNSGAMTAAQIGSWIESKRAGCTTYSAGGTTYTCLGDYRGDVTARAANANCSAVSAKSGQTAESIISIVAKACGINPRVLLVTLQKEQGLITNAKSSGAYRIAMGYGCPDTAACNTKYYGFFNQLYSASWQFEQYGKSTSFNYYAGRTNVIKYHPNSSCGTTNVYIRNKATAALYNYTPYVPNSAALRAGYGLGDKCSSYGNRNFYNYYSDWFGNPASLLKNGSFSDQTTRWGSGSNGDVSIASNSNDEVAHSGSRYGILTTPEAGRVLQQNVTKSLSTGQVYEASVWVRASAEGTTVDGALRLWTAGGTSETTQQAFSVGTEWTEVVTQLPIERTGHTGLRFAVQVDTVDTRLLVDTASLYVAKIQESRAPLTVEQTAVKSGTNGGWVPSSSSAAAKKGYAAGPVDGKYYLKLSSKSASAYVYQRVAKKTKVGQSYTVSAWVRSGSSGTDYTGRLILMGMGGTSEQSTTDFVVGEEWTRISTTLDIKNASHSSLRIRVHLDQPGAYLLLDSITLTPNLYVRDASFETGTGALNSLPAGTQVLRVPNAEFAANDLEGRAVDGRSVVLVTGTSGGAYTRLDRERALAFGSRYEASAWVRSADPGTEVQVTLRLETRHSDGRSEFSEKTYVVGDEWTRLTVDHQVGQVGLTRLRTDVILVDGGRVLVDGVTVR